MKFKFEPQLPETRPDGSPLEYEMSGHVEVDIPRAKERLAIMKDMPRPGKDATDEEKDDAAQERSIKVLEVVEERTSEVAIEINGVKIKDYETLEMYEVGSFVIGAIYKAITEGAPMGNSPPRKSGSK